MSPVRTVCSLKLQFFMCTVRQSDTQASDFCVQLTVGYIQSRHSSSLFPFDQVRRERNVLLSGTGLHILESRLHFDYYLRFLTQRYLISRPRTSASHFSFLRFRMTSAGGPFPPLRDNHPPNRMLLTTLRLVVMHAPVAVRPPPPRAPNLPCLRRSFQNVMSRCRLTVPRVVAPRPSLV